MARPEILSGPLSFPRAMRVAMIPAALAAAWAISVATGGAAAASEKPENANNSDFSRRCLECHAMDPVLSHPIDARPSMGTPGHLPLDNGRMTCTTCHEARPHSAGGAGVMLRSTLSAESFCAQCHEGTRASSPKVMGHVTLGKAHLQGATGRRSKPAARADDETRSCLGCHDGAMARDAGGHALGVAGSGERASEHPVDVRYQVRRGSETRLVESPKLDRRVRLFNGSIGCGSCHSVYSSQKRELVMSNLGSRLCLQCHVQ